MSESQRSEGDTKSTEASDIELVEISDASPVTTDVEMLSSEGILDDSDTLSGECPISLCGDLGPELAAQDLPTRVFEFGLLARME